MELLAKEILGKSCVLSGIVFHQRLVWAVKCLFNQIQLETFRKADAFLKAR